MITAADAEFHDRDPSILDWAETMFMIFSVPEENILGNVYLLTRPNLGVCTSSVMVQQGMCRQPWELDFSDPQVHTPCPASFTSFALQSGLSVEVTKPLLGYHVEYAASSGALSFTLDFDSLMRPFDMHDPDENPLHVAGLDWAEPHRPGVSSSKGHFDLIGRVTGEFELRGRRYEVDCVDGMDHSWGPRSEQSAGTGSRASSWLHVTFPDGFGLHLATALDIVDGNVVYGDLRFGYVLEDGEVFGIVEARVEADRVEMLGVSNHIWAKDVRGREYEFFGTAVAAQPWYTFNPCCMSWQMLYRYRDGDRVGHSMAADIFGLDFLAERMSRHGRKRAVPMPALGG